MKLFISKKKYDLLNKEYLLLNDKHEELKDNYETVNISNEINLNNIVGLENQILSLNQEIDLYDNTVNDLKEENEKLKKANKELAKLWNDANRKLWSNNESARQLRKLSEDILDSQRIDKSQLASYIYDISMYVGGGVGVELKSKDK